MSDPINTDELISISYHLFVATSLFTKGLGLTIESMAPDTASMRFTWRSDLTGSERTVNLHGGVIASVFDITGSLAVFSNLVHRMKSGSVSERIKRIKRINTIDLRTDYLRPAAGNTFLVSGRIMRTGRTVAVTRMELHNELDALLAVGTASYILSVAAD